MAESFFEKLVHGEMAKIQASALAISLEDPTKGVALLARLQGRYAAFEDALKLARQAARTDADEDAA